MVCDCGVSVQYYWMCPDVRCPAVSADCETREYIVFEYDYSVRGRVINVRCESCEYCLDLPPAAATHRRRRPPRSVARHSPSQLDSAVSVPLLSLSLSLSLSLAFLPSVL